MKIRRGRNRQNKVGQGLKKICYYGTVIDVFLKKELKSANGNVLLVISWPQFKPLCLLQRANEVRYLSWLPRSKRIMYLIFRQQNKKHSEKTG
jgi:hypothetical protein